jgi:hypothetical protein
VGLLPSLAPDAGPLRKWIAGHRPGTILAANVMGQFGVVAERLVERLFGMAPWGTDPEVVDPLAEAMEAWTRRAILAFLEALGSEGADLWLVHDRAVVFSAGRLELGPWEESWTRQVKVGEALEVSDPLAGLEIQALIAAGRGNLVRQERWLWPVAPGQRHVVEALAVVHSGADR